jgi:hypothetical protein
MKEPGMRKGFGFFVGYLFEFISLLCLTKEFIGTGVI